MAIFKIGTVSHYYDKIGVAVVNLNGEVRVGDRIKIVKDKEEFEQTVTSMQIEHEQVKIAKKGQSIGLKVDQPVLEKAEIFRLN